MLEKLEKIKITDDALFEIAKISDGGMRDSINFLDQLRSFNSDEITINDVYEVCGNISSFEMLNLLDSISKNNAEQVTEFFENIIFVIIAYLFEYPGIDIALCIIFRYMIKTIIGIMGTIPLYITGKNNK